MKKITISQMILLLLTVWLLVSPMEAAAGRSGGTLTISAPYRDEITTLDPHRTRWNQDLSICMNIHRSLYKWDGEKNEPVADLVREAEISGDGLTYTFTLKKNITFHNGRPLTTDDVVWSFERILASDHPSAGARYLCDIQGAAAFEMNEAAHVSGLKKIDDLTFEIRLERPVNLACRLFHPSVAVLPRKAVEENEHFGEAPVGCGPFRLARWDRHNEIVLERYTNYHETDRPYLDRVIYKIMPDAGTRDAEFRKEKLDVALVETSQYPVYKKDPHFSKNMIETAEMFTRFIGFHPKNCRPFSSKLVRQAINHAIDTKTIVENVLHGKAFPAVGFLPPSSRAFDPDGVGFEYNPEKAKALMKKAGYSRGFKFECLGAEHDAWGVKVLETLVPYLKEIKIQMIPIPVAGAVLTERVDVMNDFHAFIWSYESGPDPWLAMERWHSRNKAPDGNTVLYKNPEFDRLIDAAAAARDQAEKLALIKKAGAVFREDAPLWFFNYNKAVLVHHPWVRGLQAVAVEVMFQDLTRVWVDDSSPSKADRYGELP